MSAREGDAVSQQWLERVTTVVPPVTVLVSLMVYFAWVRRIAQANELGFDPTLLQEASLPGQLMRSVPTFYVPVVGATVLSLVALLFHRWVQQRIGSAHAGTGIKSLIWVIPATGMVLVAALGIVATFGPLPRAYAGLFLPFVVALGVLLISYGLHLRRIIKRGVRTSSTENRGGQRSLAMPALVGLLVAALLFAGVDGFAQVVGRGLGRQFLDNPISYTKAILLFSKYDVQLASADAVGFNLSPADDNGYRYRYDGLRLAFVDGAQYFLIPMTWEQSRKFIVLSEVDLRIEFIK